MNKIVLPSSIRPRSSRSRGIRAMAGGLGIALVFALGGCGGGGDSAEKIAQEACDMFKGFTSDDADMSALAEQMDELEKKSDELEARAKALDISDDDMEAAVEKACPELTGLFGNN